MTISNRTVVGFSGTAALMFAAMAIWPGTSSLVRNQTLLLRYARNLTGITRGLAAAAIPTASILMVLYSLLTVYTASVDRKVREAVMQQIVNETGYDASLLHVPWPSHLPD